MNQTIPDGAAARAAALMRFLGSEALRLGVGEHAYVVGGAVRNHVLGIAPKDIDVVVDSVALAGYDAAAFARDLERAIPAPTSAVTNQYGVAILTVKGEWTLDGLPMRGETIEVATARKESYGEAAGKGYKPHAVAPATIREDLERREFTVNTLMWRLGDLVAGPATAPTLDLTGRGLRDLIARTLNTPQDPDQTFGDDPTRMLRAVKFVAKYGFRIHPEVEAAIRRNAPRLGQMPPDAVARIFLRDVLGAPGLARSLELMEDLGLLGVLRAMAAEHPSFRAFAVSEFRGRGVRDLLLLVDYGMGADTPLRGFTGTERLRIREVIRPMEAERADEFLGRLLKPSFNSMELIEKFGLAPAERAALAPAARLLILQEPELAFDAAELTRAMAEGYARSE